jgi:nicotinamidase/pyrazinamidase
MRAHDALLVVDVQNDFVSGSMAIAGAERIIAPINALAARAPHVILAMDWHPPGHISFASSHAGRQHGDRIEAPYGPQTLFHDHCIQGSWGAALDQRLDVARAELVLRKGYRADLDSFSAFHWNDGQTRTGLAGYLRDRGIDRVHVAGLARLGCVLQSALGAAREGFAVCLIDDASVGDARRSEDECVALLRDAGGQLVASRDLLE